MLSNVSCRREIGLTGKPCSPQPLEHAPVRVELDALERADAVGQERQRTRGGHARVLLAQRARRGVARVHEHAQPGLEALLVEPLERRERQVDLAAHLDERRRLSPPAGAAAAPSIVRRFAVTSSPTSPSPRVAPRASTPSR